MHREPANSWNSWGASAVHTGWASPNQLPDFMDHKRSSSVVSGELQVNPVPCAVLGCTGQLLLFIIRKPSHCWSVWHIFIALFQSPSFNILFSLYSVIFCPPFKNRLREQRAWLCSSNIFWIVFCSWIPTSSKMHSGRRAEECLIRKRMYDRSRKMGIWWSLGTVRAMLYQTALCTANLRGELITLPTTQLPSSQKHQAWPAETDAILVKLKRAALLE